MTLPHLLLMLGTATAMELVAWAVHKYVMHGWGWAWHRDHHEPGGRRWERNDLYALVFAAIAIVLMWPGPSAASWWVGAGLAVYGALYALLHDGLVHRRLPIGWTPRRGYLRRLVQAHRLHHATHGRDGCVSFGFLYAPPARVLRQRLQAR